MKFVKFLLLLSAFSACILFSACGKNPNLGENVTRLRSNCFYGETENFTLQVYPELRESPMIADGVMNPVKKTVIIKLKVNNGDTGEYTVNFTTDKSYSETFAFSAVSDCFISTLEATKLPDKPFIATITHEGKNENVNMESLLLSDTISPDVALQNAYKEKKDYIEGYMQGGVFNGEIYLRLIAENNKNYWYVGFITEKETLCVLLNGKGKVIDERILANPK